MVFLFLGSWPLSWPLKIALTERPRTQKIEEICVELSRLQIVSSLQNTIKSNLRMKNIFNYETLKFYCLMMPLK
jgi:hypothetical protein